jgi:hypothetical protein
LHAISFLYQLSVIDNSNPATETPFRPMRIVSGGQTGVDRGALDAAIQLGIPHGGWCPAGRMAEDGVIPDQYQMQENGVANYPARTRQNVVDSDATLILHDGSIGGGTRLTARMCDQAAKPYLIVSILEDKLEEQLKQWLSDQRPQTLNVAGSRESSSPGIQRRTQQILVDCLS